MSSRLLYDKTTILGSMLAKAVNDVLEARHEMVRVQRILDSSVASTDWASLSLELGLVDRGTYTAAQQAQDLYGICQTVTSRLDHDSIRVEFGKLDQG